MLKPGDKVFTKGGSPDLETGWFCRRMGSVMTIAELDDHTFTGRHDKTYHAPCRDLLRRTRS